MKKTCSKCGRSSDNPKRDFNRYPRNRDGLHSWCKLCTRAANEAYYQANVDKLLPKQQSYRQKNRASINEKRRKLWVDKRETQLEIGKRYREKIRLEVLTAYANGTPMCACCGEPEERFLVIDHVAGGGNAHRRQLGRSGSYGFYVWLRKNKYPPGFRVLCHNCNFAEATGGCPHAIKRDLSS